MDKKTLELLVQKIKLTIQILQIQLAIKLLKQKLTVPNLPKPTYIIVHNAGGDWTFAQLNRSHESQWGFKSSLGFYLGYQYFIEYSGILYQARRDNEEGAHTIGNTPGYFNKNSIGICLQGNMEQEQPRAKQLETLKELIEKKKKEYSISNQKVIGHREVSKTSCPGKYLWNWLVGQYPS